MEVVEPETHRIANRPNSVRENSRSNRRKRVPRPFFNFSFVNNKQNKQNEMIRIVGQRKRNNEKKEERGKKKWEPEPPRDESDFGCRPTK